MTNTRRAISHAAAWCAITGIVLAFGAALSLQFPVSDGLSEPPHRPTFAVLACTIATWSTCTASEITLAARNPRRYPTKGPVEWLVIPGRSHLSKMAKNFPESLRRLLFYVVLFSIFPALTVALTTSAIPWGWVITVSCGAFTHLSFAIRQDQKWRGRA